METIAPPCLSACVCRKRCSYVCSASHASCTVLNIELRIVGSNKRLFPSGTSLDLRGHMRAEDCLKPQLFHIGRNSNGRRGVKEIDNQLEVHERSGNVPALQGQPQP